MLDTTLTFLVKNLNAYLKVRTGSDSDLAALTPVVDDSGKWTVAPGTLGVTLVNIEEERILRAQVSETMYVNGRHVVLTPPLKLNLHVLVAANPANTKAYDVALKHLSLVLTYFQAHPTFTQTEHPDLGPGIERLTVELVSLGYDQLNQMWAFLGAKYLPSAVYKVRMVVLQDADMEVAVPVDNIDVKVQAP